MRIISGQLKGRKLSEPVDKLTRPLKDLTKESIFNILTHSNKFKINLENSDVLDLFSGVGSFGIECLSRGARHVTFIENYNDVLKILKKNLENLALKKNSTIIEQNIFDGLNFENNKFDIVFIDPPYKENRINKILADIYQKKILKKNSIIIIHRHEDENDALPQNLRIVEEKIYGISKIIFCLFI